MRASPWRVLFAAGAILLVAGVAAPPAAAKKKKVLLPPQEAYDEAMAKMAKKRYMQARTLLQEILPRVAPEDRELLPKVQLGIADAFFKDGGSLNYGEALNAYKNFLTYFPQHEQAAYAQFMVGQSMFRQVLSPDRDQTMTLKAIDELKKVETSYPQSAYAEGARQTIELCNVRLAEKERLVGRFYQRRKVYFAAIDRYRYALDHYPVAAQSGRLLYDLGSSLLSVNRRDEAQEAFDRLKNAPDSEDYVKRAQAAIEDYEKRREKEGEKIFGGLGKEEPAKKSPAPKPKSPPKTKGAP
ncbi:MAG TPA: outer membrane protein assembly factor BamD [Candidatus Polarisedimenticolia bacterium]|nr:outer membrane protein assembly factor BamD [Candidatus Polarisedimenticolia bacterium]